MCEGSCDKADYKYVRKMLSKYNSIYNKTPDILLDASEVENCVSRIFHGNCRDELAWFSSDMSVGEFITVLNSF
ncbi:hypothetical protein JXB41_02750 [Candidatus Woesearchaeota archaeon]|nr:hypothetical protein [Candidatus Woesearchaeota archaeon]